MCFNWLMNEHQFEYGVLARAIYQALWTVVIPVLVAWPEIAVQYILTLIGIGIFLRPLLEKTGLYRLFVTLEMTFAERWNRKYLEKHRAAVDRKAAYQKFKKSRIRGDPDKLPKNW